VGGGTWSTDAYTTKHDTLRRAGKSSFGYTDDTLSRVSRDQWKPHDLLNIHGVDVRESRDSDEHPESVAVTVMFDVTASMGRIPRTLQTKLPELFGLLLRKGYLEHPQLMFGGIGDTVCDRVPIQISQWESDNRSDDQLGNLVLEGGGGGQFHESYELSMYFLARHTSMDCLEKRGKKGYLFLIGDELARDVSAKDVQNHIGDGLEADIPLADIAEELKQKFDVFFIIPRAADAYGRQQELFDFWNDLFPERTLHLEDPEAVCEAIALAIGMNEGAIDLDEGADHLAEAGTDIQTINVVKTALATVGSKTVATAKVEGTLEVGGADTDDVDRL